MTLNEIILVLTSIVLPILSGIGSYFMSTTKAKKDLTQLREQNKLDIEKLMNQHKMDLEALERKHQMEVEKMEIEHKHKVEIMQKEMENKLGESFMTELLSGMLNSPGVRSQMDKAILQGMKKK